jgi:GR25 family glycosyltransferase involved in LPS biosynthesis
MNIIFNEIKNYKVNLIDVVNSKHSELNNRVNKIYVINLFEDITKRNYIKLLMKKYNINYTLVIVNNVTLNTYKKICGDTNLSVGELGCCLSHLWCLYSIIKNKYKNAIIFEDDIILHKQFIQNFLQIYNDNHDFLLLGSHDYNFSKLNYLNVVNNLYKPNINNIIYGAHANYYSLKGAIAMFNIRISDINFFDSEYMLMFENFKDTSYICYPNLVIADITCSKLNHSHEILSKTELNYYARCFKNINFKDYNLIYLNLLNKEILHKEVPKFLAQNYETYITTCLYNYFYNHNDIVNIKNRLVMNFFTLRDIIFILHNKDDIKSTINTNINSTINVSKCNTNENIRHVRIVSDTETEEPS